jgi:hypothetical protein
MGDDLTIHEAAADPLINQVLRADGVPPGAFAQLLQSAARLRAAELERAIAGSDSDESSDDSAAPEPETSADSKG